MSLTTNDQDVLHLESEIHGLTSYLRQQGWLSLENSVSSVEKPGEGNMNLVLRIIPTSGRSFVIKQARPWVEKYPDIGAPVERIHVEQEYYRHVNAFPLLASFSPGIIGFDPVNHVLALEDLGQSVDLSFVYQNKKHFTLQDLRDIFKYLNHLHRLSPPENYPSNLELRKLNHQHVFYLPFHDNSFDLDSVQPGLQTLAKKCKADASLVSVVKDLGRHYLGTGRYMLHGDFYPGSLLRSESGLKIIDPEFSFVGPAEWDLAVFTAHLYLSQTPLSLIQSVAELYQKPPNFNYSRYVRFMGTEILRRLVGLAQLPISLTLDQKAWLIERSINWIKTGKIDTLSGYEQDFLMG